MAKEKFKTDKLRKPYYGLSDAVSEFKAEATDDKLKELLKEVSDLQDKIYEHLQSNYIWD